MGRRTKPKLKLMIVDDEPDNLDLLYRTFRRDFEVIQATSAITALKILDQQGEMAIIISDQRMPEMLGTDFLSKTADRFPDTIRIVLTGYTDVGDLVDAINTGKVFKYITKPWKPAQLQVVVEQAAETYSVLKQRTADLQRALRRESLFNVVTTAIRESLDYPSMLQTIVETLGQAFEASCCLLHPVAGDSIVKQSSLYCSPDSISITGDRDLQDPMVQAALHTGKTQVNQACKDADMRLVVPLAYQQELLAILSFYRSTDQQMGADSSRNPWSEEDIQLLEGVAEQAALAISQAKLYQCTQKQAKQIWAELAVARQIQSNLLRQSLPKLDTLKVQACCHPAREVGGDFFEVYQHPQGDVWLAVGDVSGKGVPAALFMASAISVLRRELSQESPPEPNLVMRNLNSILSQDLISTNYFITMILVRYSPLTKQLVYANAGHIYPLIWTKQIGTTPAEQAAVEPIYLKVRGVPLGILPEWTAIAGDITLQSGEVLLLTSDGITEAMVPTKDLICQTDSATSDEPNSMLKQAGLWQLLLQEGECLDLHHLLAKIQSHNAVQEDDQTILSLEIL